MEEVTHRRGGRVMHAVHEGPERLFGPCGGSGDDGGVEMSLARFRRTFVRVVGSAGLALLLAAPALAAGAPEPPAPAEVAEVPIGTLPSRAFPIASGPDGNVWFGYIKGFINSEPKLSSWIGRVSPTGSVTEITQVPGGPAEAVFSLTSGPDGKIWVGQNGLSSVTPTGEVTRYSLPSKRSGVWSITAGPDGNVWFIEKDSEPRDTRIGRITSSGVITDFPLPGNEPWPMQIISGPDGNLWFADPRTEAIGRVTPAGEITEFHIPPLGRRASLPIGIASGPEGALWFTASTGIGKITPQGEVIELRAVSNEEHKSPSSIVAGPDGRLWFVIGGKIGRMTPSGSVTYIPTRHYAGELTVGPDGAVWFTGGQAPCEGPCLGQEIGGPAVVGKIVPGPLTVEVQGGAPARGNWVKVRLGCGGGTAESSCSGSVRLKRRGIGVGRRAFNLPVDETRLISIRLKSRAATHLGEAGHLRVTALAHVSGGVSGHRQLVLRRRR